LEKLMSFLRNFFDGDRSEPEIQGGDPTQGTAVHRLVEDDDTADLSKLFPVIDLMEDQDISTLDEEDDERLAEVF
jgi:hypothetical protein